MHNKFMNPAQQSYHQAMTYAAQLREGGHADHAAVIEEQARTDYQQAMQLPAQPNQVAPQMSSSTWKEKILPGGRQNIIVYIATAIIVLILLAQLGAPVPIISRSDPAGTAPALNNTPVNPFVVPSQQTPAPPPGGVAPPPSSGLAPPAPPPSSGLAPTG